MSHSSPGLTPAAVRREEEPVPSPTGTTCTPGGGPLFMVTFTFPGWEFSLNHARENSLQGCVKRKERGWCERFYVRHETPRCASPCLLGWVGLKGVGVAAATEINYFRGQRSYPKCNGVAALPPRPPGGATRWCSIKPAWQPLDCSRHADEGKRALLQPKRRADWPPLLLE